MTNPLFCCIISERNKHGSLVKRLRHGPLKAETGVRFSHESPKKTGHHLVSCFSFLWVTRGRTNSLPQANGEVARSSSHCLVASLWEALQDEADSPTQQDTIRCPVFFPLGNPWSNELTATSQRRSGAEFAYPTRRSKSSLFRRRVRVYSPRAKLFPRYARPNSGGVFLSFCASSCIKTSTRHGAKIKMNF